MKALINLTDELSVYLDPSVIRTICTSQDKLAAFHLRVFSLFEEIKKQMQASYLNEPSDGLFKRQVNDCQVCLTHMLNGLIDQVPCGNRKQFIKNRHKTGRNLHLDKLILAIEHLQNFIYCRYPRYFDGSGLLPDYTRLRRLYEERKALTTLKRKLRTRLKDIRLVKVMNDYVTSFSYAEDCRYYSFNDYECFSFILEHLSRELHYPARDDRTAEVRKVLCRGGFNYPPFASYCIDYYFRTCLKDEAGEESESEKISQLRCMITAMRGTAFQLSTYPPLYEQLDVWLDKAAAVCSGNSCPYRSTGRGSDERAEQARMTVNVSVKELAMFANAVCETGLVAGSKQHIASEFCKGLNTVRTEQMSLHSFYNSLSNRDWKSASTLVVHLERMINWLNENTEIRDYKD